MKTSPRCPICDSNFEALTKYKVSKFRIYFCGRCQIGFTYPRPPNLAGYYPGSYWGSPSFLGRLRGLIYSFFQFRRVRWLRKSIKGGKILDVGAGEANFGKSLAGQYQVSSIDAPFAKLANKKVLKIDFLSWRSRRKFDAVVFWESLEHTPEPEKYIRKAFSLLGKRGLMMVEYPRFDCLERKIFGKFWYHFDVPRHLVHFTDWGLRELMASNNLKIIDQRTVFAWEYTVGGLCASMSNFLGLPVLDFVRGRSWGLILALPLLILSMLIAPVSFIMGQSPIGLVIAKKVGDGES